MIRRKKEYNFRCLNKEKGVISAQKQTLQLLTLKYTHTPIIAEGYNEWKGEMI